MGIQEINERYCINCMECIKDGMKHICSIEGIDTEPYNCCPLHEYEVKNVKD